jgi:hypothetical protein
MNGVKIIYKVKLTLTANEWYLYDISGAKQAAREINTKVAKALNNNDIQGAYEVLQEYRKYGATDTEPTAVLNEIMDKMGFA